MTSPDEITSPLLLVFPMKRQCFLSFSYVFFAIRRLLPKFEPTTAAAGGTTNRNKSGLFLGPAKLCHVTRRAPAQNKCTLVVTVTVVQT